MQRITYSAYGAAPQDVVELVDFQLPAPAAGQVLVRVLAAPINPSDLLSLTGKYGQLPPLPAVAGNEGVGKVEALGNGVTGLAIGQNVLLPVGCGTWTSHLLADAAALIALPEADSLQLSMLAVNPSAASLLLSEFADLQPGDWLIQNAANSAIGNYIIQLAKSRGLNIVNVVRRESAIADVNAEGGEWVLVDGPDLATRVAELTGGANIVFGLDAIAGASTEQMACCLSEGSTLLNHGMMSGEACQLSPRNLLFRDITLRGFWVARWFKQTSHATKTRLYAELAEQIVSGTLHTRVAATYPLTQIKEAIAAAANGERDGKIVLVP